MNRLIFQVTFQNRFNFLVGGKDALVAFDAELGRLFALKAAGPPSIISGIPFAENNKPAGQPARAGFHTLKVYRRLRTDK
jgi:hypothetical protein